MAARDAAPEIVDLRVWRDGDLLRAFYDELYLPAFPAPEHREELDVWVRDLWESPESSPARRSLLLAGSHLRDPTRRRIAGGHMFEYYPASRCGLLSYLVVAEDARRRGLGRTLVERGVAMLSEAARGELRAIFLECVDPRLAGVDGEDEAWTRLEIFERMNARVLDVPYIGPSLGEGRERARDLVLLHMPAAPEDVSPLPTDTLVAFLRELYTVAERVDPGSDPEYESIVRALPAGDVSTVELVREVPVESFPALSIALHFVTKPPQDDETGESAPLVGAAEEINREIFNSFERDLVSYAYRDSPKFASETVGRPLVRDVVFPEIVEVHSEGRKIGLVAAAQDEPGAGRRRQLRVLRSRTVFTDGVVVEHVVLTNLGLAQSDLNEFDVVKLLKLHGGGESSDIAKRMRFETAERRLVEFVPWLEGLGIQVPEPERRGDWLQAATVLVTTGDDVEWVPVYELVYLLRDDPDKATSALRALLASPEAEKTREAGRLKAVAGVVCSLLALEDVDHWELADALEPALASPEYLLWLQKANLVCLTKSDRITATEARQRDIGANPYLLAPHAVLLHNQEILRRAADVLPTEELLTKMRRSELEDARRVVVRLLRRDLLANVFHYRTERSIFEAGEQNRGLRDHAAELERRLTQLDGEIATRLNETHAREERALAFIFGVLSASVLGDLFAPLPPDGAYWNLGTRLGTLALVGLVALVAVLFSRRR